MYMKMWRCIFDTLENYYRILIVEQVLLYMIKWYN